MAYRLASCTSKGGVGPQETEGSFGSIWERQVAPLSSRPAESWAPTNALLHLTREVELTSCRSTCSSGGSCAWWIVSPYNLDAVPLPASCACTPHPLLCPCCVCLVCCGFTVFCACSDAHLPPSGAHRQRQGLGVVSSGLCRWRAQGGAVLHPLWNTRE